MGRRIKSSTLKGYEGFLEDFQKIFENGWKRIIIPDYPEAIRLTQNNGGSHSVEIHCPITAIAFEFYGYVSKHKCRDKDLRNLLGYPLLVFDGVHEADYEASTFFGSELRKKMLSMIG